MNSCTICSRFEGLPYASVNAPELPSIRVSENAPFTNTGVDFAGPLYTREKQPGGTNSGKAYICLFTCASTRAVHLELATDLSAATFLRMFQRFCSCRGLPSVLITDNTKTFKASSQQIVKIARATEVTRYLNNSRVTWQFLVERAPWWGKTYLDGKTVLEEIHWQS